MADDWENIYKFALSETDGPEHWPKGVKAISMNGLSLIGIDKNYHLYWDGRKIEIRKKFSLTKCQTFGALVVGIFAVAIGVITIWQWGCELTWLSKNLCPPN